MKADVAMSEKQFNLKKKMARAPLYVRLSRKWPGRD